MLPGQTLARRIDRLAVQSTKIVPLLSLLFWIVGFFRMNDNPISNTQPIYALRFGIGKEIQLYEDELVVIMPDEGRTQQVSLSEIKRIILMPGEPTPSK